MWVFSLRYGQKLEIASFQKRRNAEILVRVDFFPGKMNSCLTGDQSTFQWRINSFDPSKIFRKCSYI